MLRFSNASEQLPHHSGVLLGVVLLFINLSANAIAWQSHPDGKTAVADAKYQQLITQFPTQLHGFLQRYCLDCHDSATQEGKLDLSPYSSVEAIQRDYLRWSILLQRLEAKEMPPADATELPDDDERAAAVAWIRSLHRLEADRHAGDPGLVLARRLSNAEYNYTIRDLTGVDLHPTGDFPVDPANEFGFDNTGEALTMSPALLKKYLAAAQYVSNHAVLGMDGITFAPYPVVTDTDRDRYCVEQLVEFYRRHRIRLADVLAAAWQYQHRAGAGTPRRHITSGRRPLERQSKIPGHRLSDSATNRSRPRAACRCSSHVAPTPLARESSAWRIAHGLRTNPEAYHTGTW